MKKRRSRLTGSEYALLSFFTPLLVRLIPEALSWPYPLGFDTLLVAALVKRGALPPQSTLELLRGTHLVPLLYSALDQLTGDLLLSLKLLSPLLHATLCLALYLYSRRVLKMSGRTAFFAALLAGIYFVSLRISWEMHRQMLGTIFALLTLAALERKGLLPTLAAALLAFLTSWSHEFATFLLAAALLTRLYAHHDLRIIAILAPGAYRFLYQLYRPGVGIVIPLWQIPGFDWQNFSLYALGFLLYLYLPLLPLLALGARVVKHPDLAAWTLACLVMFLLPVALGGADFLWFRWGILLVYPAILASAEGLASALSRRGLILYVAAATLALNVAMSATYLVLEPEHQFNPYFGSWNVYNRYVQTSMLQNSLPLSDTPSAIEAIKWVDQRATNSTVLVLHEAFHNWAVFYAERATLVRIVEPELVASNPRNTSDLILSAAKSYAANRKEVYTVWWIPGKGWYGMPDPPPGFKEAARFGNIAVYKYSP